MDNSFVRWESDMPADEQVEYIRMPRLGRRRTIGYYDPNSKDDGVKRNRLQEVDDDRVESPRNRLEEVDE